MPLFNYRLTYATETRNTELRKSNPQGWLLQAVETIDAMRTVKNTASLDIDHK